MLLFSGSGGRSISQWASAPLFRHRTADPRRTASASILADPALQIISNLPGGFHRGDDGSCSYIARALSASGLRGDNGLEPLRPLDNSAVFSVSSLTCAGLRGRVHADARLGGHALRQLLGIRRAGRNDQLAEHVDQGQRLDVDDLGVFLHVDILPGLYLRPRVYAVAGEQRHVLLVRIMDERLRRGAQVEQPAARGLARPFLAVAVAVEEDARCAASSRRMSVESAASKSSAFSSSSANCISSSATAVLSMTFVQAMLKDEPGPCGIQTYCP